MTATAKKKPQAKEPSMELIPGQVTDILLDLIDRDENQPRKYFDPEWLKNELAPDIKKRGVQQPVTLRPNLDAPGRFLIVYGENRVNASRLAGLQTVPALPYTGNTDGKNFEIDLLLDQVNENYQRRDLNPMDFANFLHALNKVHGKSQPQIEKLLKEHNIKDISRSYISTLLMLFKLPEWAQTLIRNGSLTPAHGKYLTKALASEKVMDYLRQKFIKDSDDPLPAWDPTTRELEREIYFTFKRFHKDITNWDTKFNHEKKCIKTSCKKYRKINCDQGKGCFCLDEACWSEHQAKELARKEKHQLKMRAKNEEEEAQRKTIKVKADKNNKVDVRQLDLCPEFFAIDSADFDTTDCKKCLNCHTAVTDSPHMGTEAAEEYLACFSLGCFEKKTALNEQAEMMIVHHMSEVIINHFSENPDQAFRFMVWVGSDLPNGLNNDIDGEFIGFDGPMEGLSNEKFEAALHKHCLFSLDQFLLMDEQVLPQLIGPLLKDYLGHTIIKNAWKALGLEITNFQLDEAFIKSLNKSELIDFIQEAPDGPPEVDEQFARCAAMETGELRELTLKHIKHFPAPAAELRWAYEQFIKEDEDAES